MNKKEIIIEKARNLFTNYGYKKVSMDEIATSAKVTKKTIYHYFKDKDDLFQYFITEELESIKKCFEKVNRKKITLSEKIILSVKEVLEFRKKSQLFNSLSKEQLLGNHTNFISQYDNEIINYIEMKLKEEIEKNNIRKCDEHLTAFLIYKIFFSIFFEYDKDIQEEKIIKEVSSILEKGLIIEGGQNEK